MTYSPVLQTTGLLNSILAMDHEVTMTQLQAILAAGPACLGIKQKAYLTAPETDLPTLVLLRTLKWSYNSVLVLLSHGGNGHLSMPLN